MKTALGALIGVAAIYTAWAAATGRALPLGIGGVAAVWVVAGLGMTACAVAGIGEVLTRVGGNWLSPWVLAGIVLGTLALLAIVAAAMGFSAGPIAGTTQWLMVLAVVIGLKVAVGLVHAATFAVSGAR